MSTMRRPFLSGPGVLWWCHMLLRIGHSSSNQVQSPPGVQRCNAATLILIAFLPLSIGQSQSPVSSFPADHFEVYASFFQYQVSWQQWAAAQAPPNSPKAAQLANSFAAMLKIDPTESAVVSAAANKVASDLAALAAQRSAYLQSNSANPSTHTLNQFAVRRQQMIMAGVSALMQGLTFRSWVGLYSYVNWDYRVNGTVMALGGK